MTAPSGSMNAKHLSIFVAIILVLPTIVLAADYAPLVGIPGVNMGGGTPNLSEYFNAIYRLSISVAALLAVVKIVGAGAKYMLTDVVPAKGEALADIKGALLGLIVILAAVLILGTINRNIIDTNLTFEEVPLTPAPRTPVDPWQQVCDVSGGCAERSCSTLKNYTYELVAAGAGAGAGGGAILWGIGSIPGCRGGSGGGALAAWYVSSLAEDAECEVVCGWLGGNTMPGEMCSVPADKAAARAAEAKLIVAAEIIRLGNPDVGNYIENDANIIGTRLAPGSNELAILFESGILGSAGIDRRNPELSRFLFVADVGLEDLNNIYEGSDSILELQLAAQCNGRLYKRTVRGANPGKSFYCITNPPSSGTGS